MTGTDPKPPRSRGPFSRSTLRWLAAGGVGIVTSIAIFVAMAAAVDSVDVVDRMFRIFPLTQTTLSEGDECAAGNVASHRAVPIEGVIGYWRGDDWVPLADADVEGENAVTGSAHVDVARDGAFRFIAAFPDEAAAACGGVEPAPTEAPQRLTVRAKGCADRRVPVTDAWVPHAVALECPDRER